MTEPRYTIKWTATGLGLAEGIPDQRIKRLISQRVDQLVRSPEQQGRPLLGELAGFRSVHAVGQRYRIIYRVQRQEVLVSIVAVYALARKLLRLGLLGPHRRVGAERDRGPLPPPRRL